MYHVKFRGFSGKNRGTSVSYFLWESILCHKRNLNLYCTRNIFYRSIPSSSSRCGERAPVGHQTEGHLSRKTLRVNEKTQVLTPAKGMFLRQQRSRSFSCLYSFPGGLSVRMCRCKRFTSVPKILQNCLTIVRFSPTLKGAFVPQNRLTSPRLQKHRHYNVCAGFTPKLSQTHARPVPLYH